MQSLGHTVTMGFDRINDRMGIMARPNYTLLVSIVGLAAVLGGGAVTWYDRDYIRLNRDIQATATEVVAMGKAQAVGEYQVAQIDKITKDLDERLQREMRLINQTTAQGLTALDTRLQGEIKVVDEHSQDRRNKGIAEIEAIRTQLNGIVPDVSKFAERIDNALGQLATLNSQQKALAASVDTKIESIRKEAKP